MLLINALAGTGKTTTSLFGLGAKVPRGMRLSDEQKEIIKLMRSMKWESAAAMAFNKSIADELKTRVPPGVEAATSNSFGNRAWCTHLGVSRVAVDGYKTNILFRDVAKDVPYRDRVLLEGSVCGLVNNCKNYLIDPIADPDKVQWLADRFDLDFTLQILDYVQKVYKMGLDGSKLIDYNDQIFLPIYYGVKIPKYDMVLVDELQDLNVARQEFAFRMAGRYIVGVGDRHQAIYGFSGADSEAMQNFGARMKSAARDGESLGCAGYTELPLTITRRNPVQVVVKANQYVPDLKAADGAIEGVVDTTKESGFVEECKKNPNGAMVLCRTNAPLMTIAFRLIANNRRCFIQGKDIGAGLKSSVRTFKDEDFDDAIGMAVEKLTKKIDQLTAKSFPDENKIESLRDRIMCINYLANDCRSFQHLETKVDNLFKDSGQEGDIQLSSVHKSKGLERKHVCILKPNILPFKKLMKRNKDGTPSYQCEQELNLAYVAITRSQERLTYIEDDTRMMREEE
jgi:DNA helicase II / ATP-dependent DNA helicase PcrA